MINSLFSLLIISIFGCTSTNNETPKTVEHKDTTVISEKENLGLDFKKEIEKHCGKAYEGVITEGGKSGDGFVGERLVMQVLSCEDNQIKIPFYVGENKSRTWVLTFKDNRIQLKHDHRHEDGSEDSITMYGGTSANTGHSGIQFFPADQETCDMIAYACNNVWWMTIDSNHFSYNLRRIGSDRQFTVKFDLTKPIVFNEKPWGWKK